MTNAEKFKNVFGKYVTEMWAMPRDEYLDWSNSDYIKVVDRFYDGEDVEPIAERLAKARAEGAEEAWDFVLDTDEWDEDIRCYDTYAEAKAEYEKWKAAQKWEPKVGDVVYQGDYTGVVISGPDKAGCVYVFWKDYGKDYGVVCENAEYLTPTETHFDLNTIFEVLK